MGSELHIQFHSDAINSFHDILANFPFEPGQSIISISENLVIIDLGQNEDTNDIQDWFLNRLDEVFSYFILGD